MLILCDESATLLSNMEGGRLANNAKGFFYTHDYKNISQMENELNKIPNEKTKRYSIDLLLLLSHLKNHPNSQSRQSD